MLKGSKFWGSFFVVAVLSTVIQPAALAAQFTTAETFDINRFSPNGGQFETFYVTDSEPLGALLDSNLISAETRVLLTETATGKLAFLTDQMSFHHIAQGEANGQPWMVTF